MRWEETIKIKSVSVLILKTLQGNSIKDDIIVYY